MLYFTHVAVALAVVLSIAVLGRAVARLLRQPEVVGEIVVGLLAGPAALALLGPGAFEAALPDAVLEALTFVAKAGLVLFLVGLAHGLHGDSAGPPGRTTAWVSAGSLVLPLLSGAALAGWVVATGDPAVRGSAPLPAFFLMVMVAMSITAVPVMARVLADRGMSESAAGRLALTSAILIDSIGWLLLTVAVAAGAGTVAGVLSSGAAVVLGVACALAVRYGLRTPAAGRMLLKLPRCAAALLGTAALLVAFGMEHLGMTAILGSALIGLAIPGGTSTPWAGAVATVSRAGRALVPAFFVVTGVTVLTEALTTASWTLIVLTVVLGTLGKVLGGYGGARLSGSPPLVAGRIGVLMNTRGLTELIVLQAGVSAGLLTAPLTLALIVMALATTVMTGPLLLLLDRAADGRTEARRGLRPLPAERPAPTEIPVPTESGAR
ncbi:cation:proton antiporter [Streptomyces sp. C11-1]|uniref:Cation:proton antiporter n=1 Tax=Streptomyces durocortorensis TaxID=2811104 RepID=A0ABY9VVR1_9ACTN|nr:cation:proton antiporter [Streptomyces durocortorensis]WNF28014.1 cation:proton antiporter [Streptomyces durocortorensis]